MVFWKQSKHVEALIDKHWVLVDQSVRAFEETVAAYLAGDAQAGVLAQRVHELESQADDVRREVITELLQGALLGSYREDMLRLVEQVDRLANSADSLVSAMMLEQVRIPDALKDAVHQICLKSIAILEELGAAVKALFADMREVLAHTGRVEKIEGEIDHVEQAAIKTLFEMDLPLAEKLWVRNFVSHLAQLSDRAEDLSDLIEVIVAKRRV